MRRAGRTTSGVLAIISDIHGNLPALEAVFADMAGMGGVEAVLCLGDVVGYGPQPIECLELVAQRCKLILMGNHEHALIYGAYGFNAPARRAIEWTRAQFDAVEPPARRRDLLALIGELPIRHEFGDILLVHGSPRDPVMEYVLESDLWDGADEHKMTEIFAAFPRLCFVGHTHRPGVFTEDRCFLPASELAEGFATGDGRYLINVGSVGQPRDHDPRACYCLVSGEAVYFRRVLYDFAATVGRYRLVPELDQRLADRILRGE